MKAVVFATGSGADLGELADQLTSAMLPILDRPIVQHVVETLAAAGFARVEVVLNHQAHQVEEHLGDGSRWGVSIKYHLVRDGERPFRALRSTQAPAPGEFLLIARGDVLPTIERIAPPAQGGEPVLYFDDRDRWTGWGWLGADELDEVDDDADPDEAVRRLLDSPCPPVRSFCAAKLDARSFDALLDSNLVAASDGFPKLMRGGFQADPGIRLSRNVSLHPTARLIAPVDLGEDCRIGEGATIGPNAVVGAGCIVDRRATLSESLLFPSSYVGQGIELTGAVVIHNHLVDVRNGTEVRFEDDLLLAGVTHRSLAADAAAILARAAAITGFTAALPALIAVAIGLRISGRRRIFASSEAVRLPASAEDGRWRTYRLIRFAADDLAERWGGPGDLIFRFLPGLWNVARGEIRFVGVPPRNPTEIRALPPDWRALYLKAKAGLITESTLASAASMDSSDFLVSDAFYAVSAGFRLDLRLTLLYLRRALTPRGVGPAPARAPKAERGPKGLNRSTNTSASARGSEGRSGSNTVAGGTR